MAGGAFKVVAGAGVSAEGGDFIGLSGGEVSLGLDDEEDGRGTEGVLLLFGVEGLFLEDPVLDRSLVTGTRLLETNDGVLNVYPHLIYLLLEPDFALADGELFPEHVGLRTAVAKRNVKSDAKRVVGEVTAEDLPKGGTVSAEEESIDGGGVTNDRIKVGRSRDGGHG